MLIGAVALVDRLLPGGAGGSFVTLSVSTQLAIGAATVGAGALFFFLGRRWR